MGNLTFKFKFTNKEQWETDLEEHRPHLTRTIEEIGESWGPHKPITKRRTTRKKWNNHAATKRTITTIGELVKMKESEKGLRTQVKFPGTRGPPQTLKHLVKERISPQEGISPQERRGYRTANT